MLFLSRIFDDVDNPVNSGLKTGNKLSFIFLPNQFLLNFLLTCLNSPHKFSLIYTSSVFYDFSTSYVEQMRTFSFFYFGFYDFPSSCELFSISVDKIVFQPRNN